MAAKTPFCILSAELPHYTAEVNAHRSADLVAQLEARGLDVMPVQGCYKGTRESSYLVLCPGLSGDRGRAWSLCVTLARRYGQDSILYVDGGRGAYLTLLGARAPDREIDLGRWLEVDDRAGRGAYTASPDGRYWATE